MKKYGHHTFIKNLTINNVSHGASINYGPTIHKGHQANQKINAGEIVIGDEFTFGCPEEDEEEQNDTNVDQENERKICINIYKKR